MRKRWISIVLMITVLLGGVGIRTASAAFNPNKNYGMVRVYLSSMGNVKSVTFKPYGTYTVNGKGEMLELMEEMTVSVSGGKLYLTRGGEKTSMGTAFTLKRHGSDALDNVVKIKVKSYYYNYPGDIHFSIYGGNIRTIVRLNVEDYLKGVLPHEMSNSWPQEALKAQAVNARTYVLRTLTTNEPNYEVVDTSADQVFRGVNTANDNCIDAVDATRGQVLIYSGDLVRAYYAASNGGQTELPGNPWGGQNMPYDVIKDDPYDIENPSSKVDTATISKTLRTSGSTAGWRTKIISSAKSTVKELGYSVDEGDWSLEEILSITPCDRKYSQEESRVFKNLEFVVKVKVKDEDGHTQTLRDVTFKQEFYGDLKDSLDLGHQSSDVEIITIEETSSEFRLEVRRYGHGIGMSQRGAQTMVKDYGKNYRDVLDFYFPGTAIVKVDVNREDMPSLPQTTQEPEPSGTANPSPTPDVGQYATVKLSSSTGSLALRQSPSSTSAVIAYLRNGERLPVLGIEGMWVKVSYNSATGYAHSDYLVFDGDVPTSAPTPTQTAQPTQKPPGTEAPPITPPPASTEGHKASVTLSSDNSVLKFRNAPSSSGTVIGQLRNRQEVVITEVFDGWYQITATVNGRLTAGYASASYIRPAPGYTAQISASGGTNAFKQPSTNAAKLQRLAKGAKLQVIALGKKWTSVQLGGATGYVLTSALKID